MVNRLRLLASFAAASTLLAQSAGQLVNQDEHLSNVDKASSAHMGLNMQAANASSIPVVTRSYDNLRSGANTRETVLTPAQLAQNPLRKLFSIQLPGDARGLEAQPLFAPSVSLADGSTHDLVISTTMGNQIYAHDASDGTPLWMIRTGTPIAGSRAIDYWGINDHWGILSTGVIDGTKLYCVSWISPDGSPAKASHWLFAVDLVSGRITNKLQLTQPAPIQRKQRASLTLATLNGKPTILIPWGTIQESNPGAHGYITAVDVASFKVAAEFNVTPKGSGGGIWQAGQGLVVDDAGFIYCMTGNGDFDGKDNFGESFLRLSFDGAAFKVAGFYSPFQDSARPAAYDDMDLGSGGPSLLPSLNLLFGAGKDSIVYQLNPGSLKPIAPPFWYGFYPGPGVDPTDLGNLNRMWFNRTHHIHSSSVVWQSAQGWRVFCWAENSPLRAWSADAQGLHYLATGNEYASAAAPVPPGGMPGGMMAFSANDGKDGILWATVPDGDANRQVTTGRLLAYDAGNFFNGKITLLWQSPQFVYNKFDPPVVNGGRVYVPTYDGRVDVWGM